MKKILLFCVTCFVAATLWAQTAVTLDLTNPANPESFTFGANDVWTETYNENDYSFFESQCFMFSHLPSASSYGGMSWEGFTVAKVASDTLNSFGCMAKGGKAGVGTPYLIGYYSEYYTWTNEEEMPSSNLILFNDGEKHTLAGVNVCQSVAAYYSIKNGDEYARKFEKGDYFILKISAIDENFEIIDNKTVDFYLADYRSENEEEWILNTAWEWVDLSSFGEIDGLAFTMESSDQSYGYTNTPCYFCLDGLQLMGETSNVKNLQAQSLQLLRRGDCLEIANAAEKAEIFTLQGVKILETNEKTVSINSLPSGVYIVKCGSQSAKFVK